MTTFDDTLPLAARLLGERWEELRPLLPLVLNRDLLGRLWLVASEEAAAAPLLLELSEELSRLLGRHGPPEGRPPLAQEDIEAFIRENRCFPLSPELPGVWVADRLALEGDWNELAPTSQGAPRVAFYSMKGGVGRSTALAATAWFLAERGLRVLVVDLDLQSPGLSSHLLPPDRRPRYGLVDWLVEDLLDGGGELERSLFASSELSRNGEILVVPAHGEEPGEYLSKLGRIWMPGSLPSGGTEPWYRRLARLLEGLEKRLAPDVLLLDSRAGIDELASTCITDLGAGLVLLFGTGGEQTWTSYRLLFRHWRRGGAVRELRERLQMVAGLVPELDAPRYLERFREQAWLLFSEELYDEVPPGADETCFWSFDRADPDAPHWAWRVNWSRGFQAPHSLHERLESAGSPEILAVFGELLEGVASFVGDGGPG